MKFVFSNAECRHCVMTEPSLYTCFCFFINRGWKFKITWKHCIFWHGYRYVLGDVEKSTAWILTKFVFNIAGYRHCNMTEPILYERFSFSLIGDNISNFTRKKQYFRHGYRNVLGDTEKSAHWILMKFVSSITEYRHCNITEPILCKSFRFSAIVAKN